MAMATGYDYRKYQKIRASEEALSRPDMPADRRATPHRCLPLAIAARSAT